MSQEIQQVKYIDPASSFPTGQILDVDYDDDTGLCNGSNAENWNNILKFTGSPGNWTITFKPPSHAVLYEII